MSDPYAREHSVIDCVADPQVKETERIKERDRRREQKFSIILTFSTLVTQIQVKVLLEYKIERKSTATTTLYLSPYLVFE